MTNNQPAPMGKILLIEDTRTVREIAAEMLRMIGYETLLAEDGPEGLSKFRQHPDVELVILDLTLPGQSGEEVFDELKQMNPALKILISTGHDPATVRDSFIARGALGVLAKPFTLKAFQAALGQEPS